MTALLVVGTACDTSVAPGEDAVSESEARFLTTLTADALGDRTGGLVMTLYDLTAEVQPDTLHHVSSAARPLPRLLSHRTWRGQVEQYAATYDENRDLHEVTFTRKGVEGQTAVELAMEGTYAYEGAEREPLRFPVRAAVARVVAEQSYEGTVTQRAPSGEVVGRHTFVRDGTLSLQRSSDPMELSGTLQQEGTWEQPNGERIPYTLRLRAVDLTINRTERHIGPSTLVTRLSGVMEMEMTATLPADGQRRTVTTAGRVVFDPEANAVIRFDDSAYTATVDLDAGIAFSR
ncbi:MAG: hypothetical protein GVY12_06290 [Bacteroidetes bacterium]|jgi:hypothetical protein|nr:hypothetical protein [Bacteroidota bacterium]